MGGRHLFPFSRRSNRASRGVCAEPLEERVLMALAKATGGSGCSANLSTNPTIRQQQLICDPASALVAADDQGSAPLQGSTSVSYDPLQVTLLDARPGPGTAERPIRCLDGQSRAERATEERPSGEENHVV